MNQIVKAIKKENVSTYLTLFDNRPESFSAFSEMRLRDKELWDPGLPRRQIPFRKINSRGTFCSYKSETRK